MSLSPFSDPNDSRTDAINRMIHKLLALRLKVLKEHTPVTKNSSGGYHISTPSKKELDYEAVGAAKMEKLNEILAELEAIAD